MAAPSDRSAFSAVASAASSDASATSKFRSELREKAKKRRLLLAQQLGVSNPKSLGDVLSAKQSGQVETEALNRLDNSRSSTAEPPVTRRKTDDEEALIDTSKGIEWHVEELEKKDVDEITEEEVYTDSSAFLKGTQSDNPHNDYCQHFVDSGERPQNFIHDLGLENRFEEYPKLRELIRLKDELISTTATPPMYLQCDFDTFDLRDLNCKFDVILVEPPLEEYQRSVGLSRERYWSWEEIEALEIEKIAAPRSFLWIWCGSSDGLDAGRRCLKKWGFRRCEDICWIKTNIDNPQKKKDVEPRSIFQRTKEHCLMGIKGTVRRSTDGDFIHANVDIDLIIHEELPWGSAEKPVEIFHIIEHFCLGRRRLHVFGKDTTIRPGWLTVGPDLTSSNFDPDVYGGNFNTSADAFLTGCTDEIERLRPKSPPPKVKGGDGGGGRGGGKGRGGAGGGPGGRGGGGMGPGGRGGAGGGQRGRGGMQGRGGGGWRGKGVGGYGGGRGR